ncbi:MAG: hypothetical protein ACE15D_01515 [Candidatus Eisenbacteria bacterium]
MASRYPPSREDDTVPHAPTNPRLLLLTHGFFTEGKKAAGVGEPSAAMRGVLFLDLAVEQALNLYVIDIPHESQVALPDDRKRSSLWTEASKLAKQVGLAGLPHYQELDRLHRVRNLVQHHAHVPDPTEALRFVSPVETFMATTFDKVYGFVFATYALSDAIRNPHLRQLIADAAYVLDQGHAFVTLVAMKIAFESVAYALRQSTNEDNWSMRQITGWQAKEGKVALTLGQAIEKLRAEVALASLGISMAETGRFQRLYARLGIVTTADGSWHVNINTGKTEQEHIPDARHALDYVSSLVLAAQDAFTEAIDAIAIDRPLREQPLATERGVEWGGPPTS